MNALIPFPDFSPELFSFSLFGVEMALRWYALAYIAGIIVGWRMAVMLVRRPGLWPAETPPMTNEQQDDFLTWVILGIILGGRLGFVIFYRPLYYLENPGEILAVWQGGMAFHGGLLGVVLAAWIFSRRHNIPKLSIADMLAIAVPPGLFFGRVANFINGELWGRPTDVPWAVVFPDPRALVCPPGWEGPCGRHPSQLYEAGLEGLVLGALLIWLALARGALKTPGLVAGVFFAGYGLARFFVELFRQADPQFIAPGNPWGFVIGSGNFGITQGQLLSLPMVVLGVGLILIARRRATAPA